MRTTGMPARRATSGSRAGMPRSVAPAASAGSEARWIVGPSAIGSLNGTPTSRISAPAPARASARSAVASRFGSPAVMKGMRTARPSARAAAKTESIREGLRLSNLALRQRREFLGAPVRLPSLLLVAPLLEGDPHVVVRAAVIRIESDRPGERLDRLVHVIAFVLRDAQVVVRLRVLGVEIEHAPQLAHRLVVHPAPDQRTPEEIVGLHVLGLEIESERELRDRLVEMLLIVERHREVVVGLRGFR